MIVRRHIRFVFAVLLVFALVSCGKRIPTAQDKPSVKAWISASGQSMLPTFPESCLVECEFGIPFDALKENDTVIFWDYKSTAPRLLHHRLIQKQGGNWIAKGDNRQTNPTADWPWVTPDNYLARTTGRFTYFLTP